MSKLRLPAEWYPTAGNVVTAFKPFYSHPQNFWLTWQDPHPEDKGHTVALANHPDEERVYCISPRFIVTLERVETQLAYPYMKLIRKRIGQAKNLTEAKAIAQAHRERQ